MKQTVIALAVLLLGLTACAAPALRFTNPNIESTVEYRVRRTVAAQTPYPAELGPPIEIPEPAELRHPTINYPRQTLEPTESPTPLPPPSTVTPTDPAYPLQTESLSRQLSEIFDCLEREDIDAIIAGTRERHPERAVRTEAMFANKELFIETMLSAYQDDPDYMTQWLEAMEFLACNPPP